MSVWTIQYVDANSVQQEVSFPQLAALEGGQVVGDAWRPQFNTHKSSSITLRLPGVPADVAPVIPFESRVSIYSGRELNAGVYSRGVKQFTGYRTDRAGNSSRRPCVTYKFEDEFYFLEHLPFYQSWVMVSPTNPGNGALPTTDSNGVAPGGGSYVATWLQPLCNVVLFQANPHQVYVPAAVDRHITTGTQIKEILAWAIACGANLQVGQIDPAADVPWYPVQNVKCADALRMCLRVHPDCYTEIDYTTTPPTFNVRARANLTPVTLPYAYTDASGRRHTATDIQPRPELQPRRVGLFYRVIADGAVLSTPSDIYPAGVTTGLRALDFMIDLAGPKSVQVQAAITSYAFDPTDLAWWRNKVPSLKPVAAGGQIPNDGDPGALTLVDAAVNDGAHLKGIQVTDFYGNPVDLAKYTFELNAKSSVHAWMKTPGGAAAALVEATVTAFFTYDKSTGAGDTANTQITDTVKEHKHHVRIKLTNLPTGNYSFSQYTSTGESQPAGLAQTVFTALATLQYELTHTIVEKPFNGWLKPGKHCINLAGGEADWAAMNATLQTTDYRMHTDGAGGTFDNFDVRCGPVEHLEPGELVQLFNLFQNRDLTKVDTNERLTGTPAPGMKVVMPADSAQENSVPAEPLPVVSNNVYVGDDGNIGGQMVHSAKLIADIHAATTPTPVAGATTASIKTMQPREVMMCDADGNQFYAIVHITDGYTKA